MVPAAEDQTDMRRGMLFWLNYAGADIPEFVSHTPADRQRNYIGTWLVRSAVSPAWHPVECDVPEGTGPERALLNECIAVLGMPPKFTDTLDYLQPGDVPGVNHTTFVLAATGPGLPRPELPGVELGYFPVNNLPEADLDPRLQGWLSPLLTAAGEAGMSRERIEYFLDNSTPHYLCRPVG